MGMESISDSESKNEKELSNQSEVIVEVESERNELENYK